MGKRKESMTDHVTRFLQLLDSQIARDMQRSPSKRESLGEMKWEPFNRRIERVVEHLVVEFGNQKIALDSLLVASVAFPRAARILIEELGESGLGKVRSGYCRDLFQQLERDSEIVRDELSDEVAEH